MAATDDRIGVRRLLRLVAGVFFGAFLVFWYAIVVMAERMWLQAAAAPWQGRHLHDGGIGWAGLMVVVVVPAGLLGMAMSLAFWTTACRLGRLAMAGVLVNITVHLLVLASVAVGIGLAGRGHQSALRRFDERSGALIAGIGRYEHDLGRPPPSLAALVPRYLSTVPGTGSLDDPVFGYRPHTIEMSFDLALTDPRNSYNLEARVTPWSGVVEVLLWPAHQWRKPQLPAQLAFDAARWRREPAARAAMIDDLIGSRRLIGLDTAHVKALLGQPVTELALFRGRWRLTVGTTMGLDSAMLSYQPDGQQSRPWRGRWQATPILDDTRPIDMGEGWEEG